MKSKAPSARSHDGDGSINAFLSRIKDSPFAEPFAKIDAKVLAEGLVKNVWFCKNSVKNMVFVKILFVKKYLWKKYV